MKLNILLSIASIYMALVGIGLIFAPQAFGVGAVPIVGRRAAPEPWLLEWEMITDRITGFNSRDRDGAKRAHQRSASCLTPSCPALRAARLRIAEALRYA